MTIAAPVCSVRGAGGCRRWPQSAACDDSGQSRADDPRARSSRSPVPDRYAEFWADGADERSDRRGRRGSAKPSTTGRGSPTTSGRTCATPCSRFAPTGSRLEPFWFGPAERAAIEVPRRPDADRGRHRPAREQRPISRSMRLALREVAGADQRGLVRARPPAGVAARASGRCAYARGQRRARRRRGGGTWRTTGPSTGPSLAALTTRRRTGPSRDIVSETLFVDVRSVADSEDAVGRLSDGRTGRGRSLGLLLGDGADLRRDRTELLSDDDVVEQLSVGAGRRARRARRRGLHGGRDHHLRRTWSAPSVLTVKFSDADGDG